MHDFFFQCFWLDEDKLSRCKIVQWAESDGDHRACQTNDIVRHAKVGHGQIH